MRVDWVSGVAPTGVRFCGFFLSQNTYISLKSYSTKRVLPFVVAVEPGESMMARYGLWRMADRSISTLVGLSGYDTRVTRLSGHVN